MAEQVHREFGIPVEYEVTGEAFEFPRDTIHEVLMAMREAMYNAVRHGHPRRVRILVGFEGNECQLRVVDDGIGFNPDTLPSFGMGHYGLLGIKERVQRIGGRFVVNSKEGAGTEVVLYVPRKRSVTRENDEVPTVL
jgi:signal transduction histidine kinase